MPLFLTLAGFDATILLQARLSGERIPVWVTFSAPIQKGPEAHQSSYTMDTVLFSRVKRSRLKKE